MRNLRRKIARWVLIGICAVNFSVVGTAFAVPVGIPSQAINDGMSRGAQGVEESEAMSEDSVRSTILPQNSDFFSSVDACKKLINVLSTADTPKKDYFHGENVLFNEGGISFTASDILACGIKTGSISLWMVPYYVRYVLEFAIQMAGLVAVAGIVYGGYLYLFAGVSDEKDKGKKAIMYSVAGMILTMVAWAIVNIVVGFLTG